MLAIRIVIDGYNLLNCSPKWQRLCKQSLAQARAGLLRNLGEYKAHKKHPVLVVFDGVKGGWPTERKERQNNIDIIYSRQGEQADDVIRRLVDDLGESAVVVTSDRELADSVIYKGATVISAGQFEGRLMISSQTDDLFYADDEDDDLDKPITTKKKGCAYRRPKRERQRQAKLRKL